MPLPPDATSNRLFSCLDPQDINSYSRTCRDAYRQVELYWNRALCIYRLLSRFFTEDEAKQFRGVQASTGTLISGSMALQFFNRVTYLGSDLDLYVERRYCEPVASFLTRIGYKYEPRGTQDPLLTTEIFGMADSSRDIDAAYDDVLQNQCERGFAGVLNMTRGQWKVQLIAAKRSPMEIILNFHSTVVMNVISHSRAYSLYPEATFRKSLSLICYQCDGAKSTVPIQKYIRRGWRMINYDGIEYVPSTSALQPGEALPGDHEKIFRHAQMRHLGDAYCWTYKLPDVPVTIPPKTLHLPTVESGAPRLSGQEARLLAIQNALASMLPKSKLSHLPREEVVEGNSWALGKGSDGFGHMNFTIPRMPRLRYMYCIVPGWKPRKDPKAPFKNNNFTVESDDLLLGALVKQRALQTEQAAKDYRLAMQMLRARRELCRMARDGS